MRVVGVIGVAMFTLGAAGAWSLQCARPAGQAEGAVPPGTVYSRIADAVLRTDRLIKTDPRPFFKNVESLIIVEDGHVKFEAYYHGTDRNAAHIVQSQTKSVVASSWASPSTRAMSRTNTNACRATFQNGSTTRTR